MIPSRKSAAEARRVPLGRRRAIWRAGEMTW